MNLVVMSKGVEHRCTFDGSFRDMAATVRAQFGSFHIEKVMMILPEGKPVDITEMVIDIDFIRKARLIVKSEENADRTIARIGRQNNSK